MQACTLESRYNRQLKQPAAGWIDDPLSGVNRSYVEEWHDLSESTTP